MSRRFRLGTVERLREAAVDRAVRELAAARTRLGAALHRQESLTQQLMGCRPANGSSASDALVAAERRVMLREQLEVAAREAVQAREDAARAVTAWSSARADLAAVQNLHQRHRDAVAVDLARREQREIDDLASRPRIVLGDRDAEAAGAHPKEPHPAGPTGGAGPDGGGPS